MALAIPEYLTAVCPLRRSAALLRCALRFSSAPLRAFGAVARGCGRWRAARLTMLGALPLPTALATGRAPAPQLCTLPSRTHLVARPIAAPSLPTRLTPGLAARLLISSTLLRARPPAPPIPSTPQATRAPASSYRQQRHRQQRHRRPPSARPRRRHTTGTTPPRSNATIRPGRPQPFQSIRSLRRVCGVASMLHEMRVCTRDGRDGNVLPLTAPRRTW